MYAAYGPLSFEVLASPQEFKSTQKYHYGKLDVIGAPPILQWIYDDLSQIKLKVLLHSWWCNCQSTIEAFQNFAATHTAQALVFGNGIHVGNYLIEEMSIEHTWQADDGSIIATQVSLDLVQYAGVIANLVPSQMEAASNPPGLSTSQASAPGAAIVQAPATANPSSIPVQTPYTNIPTASIARGY